MKLKGILLSAIVIMLSLVSCSNENAEDTKSEEIPTEQSISFREYLKNADDQLYSSESTFLGIPAIELINGKNDTYSIHPNNDPFMNNMKVTELIFDHDSMERKYVFYSDCQLASTYVEDRHLYKYDLVREIRIDLTGVELFPGIRIGDTMNAIALNTNTYFEPNDKNGGFFDLKTTNVILTFRNSVLSSLTIFGGGLSINSDDSTDHGFETLKESIIFLNERGLSQYDLSNLTYYAKRFYPEHCSWFYVWRYEVQGNYEYYEEALVESAEPFRVFYGSELFWMNHRFVHPCAAFIGKWRNPKYPSYELDIEYVSEYGEVQANFLRDGHLISGINGVIEWPDSGDLPLLYDCDFFAKTEYENQEFGSGYFSYEGYNHIMCNYIGFDTDSWAVHWLVNGGTSIRFYQHEAFFDETHDSLSDGYMRDFGLNDPQLSNHIMENNGSLETKGGNVINQYFNANEGTENLDYTAFYFDYLYDYCYENTSTLYYVWKFKRTGEQYYVDFNNQTILVEDCNSKLTPTIKRAVWSNGQVIGDDGSVFVGDWVSEDARVNLSFKLNSEISIYTTGAIINDFETIPTTIMKMNRQSKWFQFNYFGYEYGPYVLKGFLLLNLYTWELSLHITRSNIPGIEMGIRKMSPQGHWTYGDNIDDYETSQDPETPSNQGKTLASVSYIRDFYGRLKGKIETYDNGDQIGYNFYGQIVGYYYQDRDVTTDFYGVIVSYGNTLSALIMENN